MSITETVTDTVTDTVKNIQDWSLEALKASDDAVLSAAKTVVDRLEPVADRLPTAPAADALPEPKDVVGRWFTYFEAVLSQQKKFSLALAKTLAPAPSTKSTSHKASTTRRPRAAA